MPLQISSSQDSAVHEKNLENSLIWFADLCSEFGSINNITASPLNTSTNSDSLNMSTEITQRLSSCPAISQEFNESSNASVKDDENVELSIRIENVSTEINVLKRTNVPIDNSVAII